MTVDYINVIQQSRGELKELIKARDGIEMRITQVVIALRSLVRLMPDEAQRQAILDELKAIRRRPPTMVEAISEALKKAKESLTANEIREELETIGFDLSEYSQPLAVVMTTLKRLVAGGSVKRSLSKEKNAVVFKWAGDSK